MIPETIEVDRRPHEVARELVEALGIAGIDGGAVMNFETKVIPTMHPEREVSRLG
jgi:hypothetical protein